MNTKEILAELDRLLSERKLKDAEAFLDEQVKIAKNTRNSSLLLTLLNEQEGIYRNTHRAESAVACGEQALELIEVLGLTGSRFHAVTLINSATACRMNEEPEKALRYYREALKIITSLSPEDPGLAAACLNNMSQVWQEEHQDEKALECLQKAYDLIRKVPGRTAEAAVTAQNIAISLMALGKMSEAYEYLSSAGNYFESEAGQKDRHAGAYYSAIAEYFLRTGKKEKALENYRKALELIRSIYGENDACGRIRSAMKTISKEGFI